MQQLVANCNKCLQRVVAYYNEWLLLQEWVRGPLKAQGFCKLIYVLMLRPGKKEGTIEFMYTWELGYQKKLLLRITLFIK